VFSSTENREEVGVKLGNKSLVRYFVIAINAKGINSKKKG